MILKREKRCETDARAYRYFPDPRESLSVVGGSVARRLTIPLLAETKASMVDLKSFVRDVPDYPKPGILFRDITPLLGDPQALVDATDALAALFEEQKIDVIAAAEARGFIFAAPLAIRLGAGFVPIRKPGKLPYDLHTFAYDLEYGSDELQIHVDGVQPGQRVLLVDDLLATGGTMEACCRLLEKTGAEIVGCAFLIHLVDLGGDQRLTPYPCRSVLSYGAGPQG